MPIFVDTSLLVYWRDSSDAAKQRQAQHWLGTLWRAREGRISVQVLNEYYVTVTRKLRPGLDPATARSDVLRFSSWRPVLPDMPLVERAWQAEDRHGLSFWDALIVAAAQRSGCTHLLSEDLSNRQNYDGVEVVDPFTTAPERLQGH